MKTVKYTILQDLSVVVLIEEVNLYIAKGWEPIGGVCRYQHRYHQAMVLTKTQTQGIES